MQTGSMRTLPYHLSRLWRKTAHYLTWCIRTCKAEPVPSTTAEASLPQDSEQSLAAKKGYFGNLKTLQSFSPVLGSPLRADADARRSRRGGETPRDSDSV